MLLLAGAVWGVAFLSGRLVCCLGPLSRQLRPPGVLRVCEGIGLSAWSLFTLAVGLLGGLRQPLDLRGGRRADCGGLRSASLATGRSPARARTGESRRHRRAPAPVRLWRPRWWWLAVPFVLVIVGGALLPPVDFDVLEYHLQVPREWVQSGRIAFLPHNVYGNMPLGAETLAALTMALSPGELGWWWGALAGKLVMAGFAPLAAVLLVAAGRRFASPQAGIVAALIYLSTPWIVLVSVNGLNEGVIAYYLLAAAYAAKLWLDAQQTDPAAARGYVWLAGWMAGSAVACKYTSVVFVVMPLLVLVAVVSRRGGLVRAVLAFVLAVTCACGLWLAKNGVQTGNPVYPLLAQCVRRPHAHAGERRAVPAGAPSAGRCGGTSLLAATGLGVAAAVAGRQPLAQPADRFPSRRSIVLRRRTLRQAAFWLLGLLYVVAAWWLCTHRLERFLVPAWPLLALAAGIGATWSVRAYGEARCGRWWRWAWPPTSRGRFPAPGKQQLLGEARTAARRSAPDDRVDGPSVSQRTCAARSAGTAGGRCRRLQSAGPVPVQHMF